MACTPDDVLAVSVANFSRTQLSDRVASGQPIFSVVDWFHTLDDDGNIVRSTAAAAGWKLRRSSWLFELRPFGVIMTSFPRPRGSISRNQIRSDLNSWAVSLGPAICRFVFYDVRDTSTYSNQYRVLFNGGSYE